MFEMQRFAEVGEIQQEQQTTQTNEGGETDSGEQKSDAKQEIDIDAKIAEALTKAQKNFEESLKKRDAERKKEEERLSKLNEDERKKTELENSMKELEVKEKELQRKELMLEMTKVLAERKIPVQFMEYLTADDNESTLERIKTFEKKYKAAIEAAVTEKLKGKAPTAGSKSSSNSNAPVKDGFMKIITENQVKRG